MTLADVALDVAIALAVVGIALMFAAFRLPRLDVAQEDSDQFADGEALFHVGEGL